MPIVDNVRNKQLMVDTVKNGWVNKTEKENYTTSVDSTNKFDRNEDLKISPIRAPAVVNSNEGIFKRNDVKTSSLTKNYRKKSKGDKASTSRYANYSIRNSGDFKEELK